MPAPEKTYLALLKKFFVLAKAFFNGGAKRVARLWLATLLGLCCAVGVVQVFLSYAMRDFITALSLRDEAGWMRSVWKFVAVCFVSVPVGVFYRYSQERLSLAWRRWLTQHLIKRYFFNRAYYRIRASESVDNPDQRIAEDVKLFTTGVLNFFLVVINSVVTLVAFLGVLWSVSGQLVSVLCFYAAVGTGVSMFFGRRLVGLYFNQYQKEATFRYGLIRIRENAESIAFFRGEKREHRDLIERLNLVLDNTFWIIGWTRNLGFFANGYNYLALIIPGLIVGPMFLRGAVEFGVVTQAQGAFASVLAALSIIIAQIEGLSSFTAGIRRLGDLWDNLDEFDAEDAREAEEAKIEVNEEALQLKLDDVTVQTPGGEKTLTQHLSFQLPRRGSLLVMGESGSGKSSLLRTIAGLWQSGSGAIDRPAHNRLIFLPQKPYMVPGNLRAQLVYPLSEEDARDDAITAVLEQVNLHDIFARVGGDLGKVVDWTNVLSLGEQQRVAFARLFLKKPAIAFLDEATSALDEENERFLYEKLRASGIAFVSIGHRSTLKEFHDRVLILNKDGTSEIASEVRPPKKHRTA
ncbi:MAG: vitamin B12/bleomycin/antimicrobial peptide transport system ATP-binding/permease protein [Chthoniobacter sp.]|jgi:putative ATP-binding cassette transporter|nr:vitamin B12/bleomycin/antimicrobial peptide transport system ATP-binding/permease protein [Chthoniobacter sp.]